MSKALTYRKQLYNGADERNSQQRKSRPAEVQMEEVYDTVRAYESDRETEDRFLAIPLTFIHHRPTKLQKNPPSMKAALPRMLFRSLKGHLTFPNLLRTAQSEDTQRALLTFQ